MLVSTLHRFCGTDRLLLSLVSAVLLVASGAGVRNASADQSGTHLSGQITSDGEWTAAGSPYVLDDNTTIAAGTTITVDPGAVILGPHRLNVVGVLDAVGSPADPIMI